jgi:hypothetical protein
MRYRRHLDGRHDIHWPAFVDIFIVLMAVSLLGIPTTPPANHPSATNGQTVPTKAGSPDTKIVKMRPDQFRDKRLSCRLVLAERELKLILPDSSAAGGSIRVKIPGVSLTSGSELPGEAKQSADHIRGAIFDLRSRWSSEPAISVNITKMAVRFDGGQDDCVARAIYAAKLRDHLSSLLPNADVPVTVEACRNSDRSGARPQVWIITYTELTGPAQVQAEADRQQGKEPCPISPK